MKRLPNGDFCVETEGGSPCILDDPLDLIIKRLFDDQVARIAYTHHTIVWIMDLVPFAPSRDPA